MPALQVHRPTFVSANGYYHEYGKNDIGRDFIIGDVHGEYDGLIALLQLVGFVFGVDRLFLAGDLVDRGTKPLSVLGLTQKDGVISVRGNHDQWCITAGLVGEPSGHRKYGGKWFYHLSEDDQRAVAIFLNALPVALTFVGPCGNTFGLVHAECTFHRWDYFKEVLCGELGSSLQDHHVTEAIWRLTRFEEKNTLLVSGVSKVFVGHTVVEEVMELGNTVYLDTGGCFDDGRLTLLELQADGGYRLHRV